MGDAQYFYERAQQERAAAEQASYSEARAAHLELASRYAGLAEAISKDEERLGIDGADDPLRQRRF